MRAAMLLASAASAVHRQTHFPHCRNKTDEDGTAHDRMPDVQLFALRNGCHGTDVPYGEAVSRVHREPELGSRSRGVAKRFNRVARTGVVRITPRVQLNRVRAEVARTGHHVAIRVNEQTGPDASLPQAPERVENPRRIARDVQASLGRDLLASLGHERDLMRTESKSDLHHLRGARHLEIQCCAYCPRETFNVGILDVTPIFPQVRRDSVRSSFLAERCGSDGVGLVGPPCLPNGRDVIDVDAETLIGCAFHGGTEVDWMCRWRRRPLPPNSGIISVRSHTVVESRVKKLILLVLVVTACHSGASAPGNALTGAPAPRRAVEQFLAAVKSQDLQAMSVIWGTAKGPARDQIERTELEKREIIMQSCYDHDKFKILDESPSTEGKRLVRVQLTRGSKSKTPGFVTVKGPSDRWYVQDADFNAMRDFCKTS